MLIHVHAVHTVIPYGGHDVSVHVVGDAANALIDDVVDLCCNHEHRSVHVNDVVVIL